MDGVQRPKGGRSGSACSLRRRPIKLDEADCAEGLLERPGGAFEANATLTPDGAGNFDGGDAAGEAGDVGLDPAAERLTLDLIGDQLDDGREAVSA